MTAHYLIENLEVLSCIQNTRSSTLVRTCLRSVKLDYTVMQTDKTVKTDDDKGYLLGYMSWQHVLTP